VDAPKLETGDSASYGWVWPAAGVVYGISYVFTFPLMLWAAGLSMNDSVEYGATPAMEALSFTIGQHRWPPVLGAAIVVLGCGGFHASTPAWQRFIKMSLAATVLTAAVTFAVGYWRVRVG